LILKSRRNIFTILNLAFFMSSLLFASLSGFYYVNQNQQSNLTHIQFIAKHNVDENNCAQFVFEQNERETEDGMEAQAFILPFMISFLQFSVGQPRYYSDQLLTEKLTNPIYLSVCNFRI
jgi:hypothetical protein